MTLNNSMSITPSPPGHAKGVRFEHGSVLGGKTRAARVSSQWKSTCLADNVAPGVDFGLFPDRARQVRRAYAVKRMAEAVSGVLPSCRQGERHARAQPVGEALAAQSGPAVSKPIQKVSGLRRHRPGRFVRRRR